MSIIELFNAIKSSACQHRQKNMKFDGQQFWQQIKQIASLLDEHPIKWKKIDTPLYRKLIQLPEYTINGKEEKKIIEINHFLIQLVRIPKTEKATLKKILQIGLNLGQYQGMKKHTKIFQPHSSVEQKITVKTLNGLTKLEDFVSTEELKKLDALLQKNPQISEDIHKYLKSL